MGVGTRSPSTTGGSYDDWRLDISKARWLLRCSLLHRAQIAMIDMIMIMISTSAMIVESTLLLLLCTYFFLAAATVGAISKY